MEAETSKNYNQGLNWLFYMTWSDFENSPSLSSQPDWMTLTCPFQPSKSCKDSQKLLFYPVDYKNSISNSFSFTRRKRPRQLSGALQPWNKERVSTDTTKLFGASSAFHSLPLLWDGIPASPLKKKSQNKVKDELWRCRPCCCCCSSTAVKECWLQHQTSRVSSLVLKPSQLGTHPSLLCHSLAGFINCSAGTYRCSTPPQTELEHSRSVPVCALDVVFLSSCFVLNPTKLAIP